MYINAKELRVYLERENKYHNYYIINVGKNYQRRFTGLLGLVDIAQVSDKRAIWADGT